MQSVDKKISSSRILIEERDTWRERQNRGNKGETGAGQVRAR